MSGHSHSRTVKHRKDAVDAKRGKIFSRLSRLISIAAKEGGSDPAANSKLRLAIDKAREANMPKDNIERAVKRGAVPQGGMEGTAIEEVIYEAYGPGGAAFIIIGITDNKNRTVAEIKNVLNRFHGKLAGSVKYLFNKTETGWEAKYLLKTDPKTSQQIVHLIDTLKNLGDVQEVYSNFQY